MNDILTVIKFTMKDMLKRKSYIITTIIILVMIVIGFNIPRIISSFKDQNEKNVMLISDQDNLFDNQLDKLISPDGNYEIVISNDSLDKIKEKIKNEEIDCGIYIEKKNDDINLEYVVENIYFFDDKLLNYKDLLASLYKDIQIDKLDISEEKKALLNPMFIYDISQSDDEAKGNLLVIMLLSIALFYTVYFGAYQVSSSITTEKTSKIIETLVTSTSPKNIVLGKTLGIGMVGLLQLILIIITAYISATSFLDVDILNKMLDMSTITLSLGLFILLYFLLGYFAFALLYALTGSTVSKPEDIQSANTPVTIITMASFYLAYFTMMNPGSSISRFASLFPFSSPFCMPFKIMMGLSSKEDIVLSIFILIITIVIIANVSIRIYSNAIINYGTKLSLKEIIEMYKEKQ